MVQLILIPFGSVNRFELVFGYFCPPLWEMQRNARPVGRHSCPLISKSIRTGWSRTKQKQHRVEGGRGLSWFFHPSVEVRGEMICWILERSGSNLKMNLKISVSTWRFWSHKFVLNVNLIVSLCFIEFQFFCFFVFLVYFDEGLWRWWRREGKKKKRKMD
jgi:hypothetical protein